MEAILRHGYTQWSDECFVAFQKPPNYKNNQHPTYIHALLQKHERVFIDLPAGQPPYKGFEHIIESGGNTGSHHHSIQTTQKVQRRDRKDN